ncbi:SDR family NAD(P)-dependent oxidoreductase [Actinomadura sp. SCN-SB]|uniref:SDR family NAD(P)-dependent oxidoreductase n=1 Tax=Actinomadura sp. SCN-SB TaxID=3373092 RepID=UPI0037505B9B
MTAEVGMDGTEVGTGHAGGGTDAARDLPPADIIGIGPFGRPAPRLVAAVCRAGGLGVLDLGTDRAAALAALGDVMRWWRGPFGVRVPAGSEVRPEDLPDAVRTVLIDAAALRPEPPRPERLEPVREARPVDEAGAWSAPGGDPDDDDWTVRIAPPGAVPGVQRIEGVPGTASAPQRYEPDDGLIDAFAFAVRGRRILVEVVDPEEAIAALARFGGTGVLGGLIARGFEGGGRVGHLTTFVLLQRLLGDAQVNVPVWACGGIGPHTAAAAVAGGAAGVVLDSQLALVREVEAPADIAAAMASMDGAETRIVQGRRVYAGSGGRPLPVGQDGALARPLAARYKTAGGVVQAIRAEIAAHIRAAVRAEPLAPKDVPDAPEAGRRYPIVQGPMTRVSDRPVFAAAVAQDGGLPFLALALMDGEEARSLLRDTAERLGDLPWGVGILGFVPPEVREAQLEAIRAVRPPYALIAGGRPAHAASLEAAGISTYLHVPSPARLERLLAEGARKFVFEGAECGGHIGPRGSFALWEAQVERLLAFCDANRDADGGRGVASELSVMFAGGIHDERSAAMVAALAGPLAERGADIRVLMGTAYLFTYEAVASGAITPGYQQAAVECDGTALLETSPGQVTRCAWSPYVETFTDERRRLEELGTPPSEMGRNLEDLNLGRLRIATKGLRRVPGGEPPPGGVAWDETHGLISVDSAEQRREGLFMLGQVAALRWATTSITGLHEQVSTGATFFLATRAATLGLAGPEPRREPPAPRPMDIAIVGAACVFPGAPDTASYWANIVRGVDAVTEVPAERWDPELYYDPDAGREGRTPCKWGGFIPGVPFDALAHGVPPTSLDSIDPAQLLGLEVAFRALRDAGYGDRPFDRSRASVFFGAATGAGLGAAYAMRALLPMYYGDVPPGLDAQLPRPTEDSLPGALPGMIAGRIAERLGLGGTACAIAGDSGMAALDAACKELLSGGSDLVLCGGADLRNGIHDYLLAAAAGELSPSGRCAPFDASSDGFVPGEGVACVALKRLADAERDGDRIYAVIKSVVGGAAADGETPYLRAGVSPARVGLVEAEGTGTPDGDRAELAALTRTFTAAGARPGGTTLGSVRSQIGHTRGAAGLAGLIKTAYALHTGTLPGTLHLTAPTPDWDAATSPFAFGRTTRPWAAPPAGRYAGLRGPGSGGAAFHAVLAGYDGAPEPVSGISAWPAELFLIRGAGRAAARAELDRLGVLLAPEPPASRPRLRDLARTFAEGEGPVQVALVATGLDDLERKLAAAREFRPVPGVYVADEDRPENPGQVAFLYPGQGSQRPGMLADLFVAFPRLQRLLRLDGGRYADAMFPPAAFTPEEAERQRIALTDTRVAQPALGIAGLAVHRLLTALGVRPDLAAGHSHGELVALCAAGVFGEEDLIALSAVRAEAVLAAAGTADGTVSGDAGAMAVVAARLEEVRTVLTGVGEVVVANHNAPRQVVISGSSAGIDTALGVLREHGIRAKRLPVACAFHSPLVARASAVLRAELERRDLRSPAYPVWSNSGAVPYDTDPAELRGTLAGQVAVPVRFVEQIEAMYESGARVFVEAGPGRALTQLVGMILGDRPHTAVAVDAPPEEGEGSGLERLLPALAKLAVAGVPVDPLPLFSGRDARPIAAGDEQPVPGWIVDGHLVRTADGAPLRNGLRPPERISPFPEHSPEHGDGRPVHLPAGMTAHQTLQDSAAEEAVLEYLRAGRELVAAQREVLLNYLSGSVPDDGRHAGEDTGAGDEPPPAESVPPLPVPGPRRALPGEVVHAAIEPPRGPEAGGDSVPSSPEPPKVPDTAEAQATRPLRQVVRMTRLPDAPAGLDLEAESRRYAGLRFVIVDDGCGVALELGALLERMGAQVRTPMEPEGPCDGLVHLAALRQGCGPVLPGAYGGIRDALNGGARWVVLATGSGGTFGRRYDGSGIGDPTPGAGLRGLARTLAREYPEALVRALDVDTKDSPRAIALRILAEMADPDAPVEVGHDGGTRCALTVVPTGTISPAGTFALDANGVVLLTGGPGGVTGRVALELARRTGCHIELVGATPDSLPDRRDELSRHAASVRFHSLDVRDLQAVSALVEDVYARHGRLDGVVHGAGNPDDLPVDGDDPGSFARIYRTKVDGARALAASVRPDLGFFVVLGSTTGPRGGPYRIGHAAAGDACATLAHVWRTTLRGRILVAGWDPWADDPQAVPPLDPDTAVAALLDEIAQGDEPQVVFTAVPT